MNRILVICVLLVLTASICCFPDNRNDMEPARNSVKAPDNITPSPAPGGPLEAALALDRNGVGTGKINLAVRLEKILKIIAAYESLEIPQPFAVKVSERIETLRFEAGLITTLQNAFRALPHFDVRKLKNQVDCYWLHFHLAEVFSENTVPHIPFEIDHIHPQYRRMLNPAVKPDPGLVPEDADKNPGTNNWIIGALNIDPRKPPVWFRKQVFEAEGLNEYELTHQFFALILQRSYWPDVVHGDAHSKKVERLAHEIARAQNAEHEFSDIYAERAAMLAVGGFGHLVKRSALQLIIDSRLPGGLWARPPRNNVPNAHATTSPSGRWRATRPFSNGASTDARKYFPSVPARASLDLHPKS